MTGPHEIDVDWVKLVVTISDKVFVWITFIIAASAYVRARRAEERLKVYREMFLERDDIERLIWQSLAKHLKSQTDDRQGDLRR